MLILLGCIFAVISCEPPPCESKWGYQTGGFDRYKVSSVLNLTPKGIRFDDSNQNFSYDFVLDKLTDEVEGCLHDLTKEEIAESHCITNVNVNRNAFVVKIPFDWTLSCDGSQEVLSVVTHGCESKGLIPTQECPCRYRAGIACPNIIVSTPSFFLYKDALIRFITGCENPWAYQPLAACATPTVPPLHPKKLD